MQKIPFEFLKSKIDPDPITGLPVLNLDMELRSPEAKAKYQKDLAEIKEKWVSVQDYILVNKFNYIEATSIYGLGFKSYADRPPLKSHNQKWVLDHSDYSQDLIDADFYYILWINSKDPEVIRKAIKLTKPDFAGSDYIYFQNKPHNQSVGLTHFHFLVKK